MNKQGTLQSWSQAGTGSGLPSTPLKKSGRMQVTPSSWFIFKQYSIVLPGFELWMLVPLDLCTWEHSVDVVAPQKPLGIWSRAIPYSSLADVIIIWARLWMMSLCLPWYLYIEINLWTVRSPNWSMTPGSVLFIGKVSSASPDLQLSQSFVHPKQ